MNETFGFKDNTTEVDGNESTNHLINHKGFAPPANTPSPKATAIATERRAVTNASLPELSLSCSLQSVMGAAEWRICNGGSRNGRHD